MKVRSVCARARVCVCVCVRARCDVYIPETMICENDMYPSGA